MGILRFMESRLEHLCGRGCAEAFVLRGELAEIAYAHRARADLAAGRAAFASLGEYVASLALRTVCLTLLAGSGSRWVKSLAAAEARGEGRGFDPARPRGLYPVRDFTGRAGSSGTMPIASYAMIASRGLGRHLLVVRGWEAEIDEEILVPLGIGRKDRDFFTQEAPFGKPLGHGDAAWQCRDLWRWYRLRRDEFRRRRQLPSHHALGSPGPRRAQGRGGGGSTSSCPPQSRNPPPTR